MGNILPDTRKMFEHACAFSECAQFCESENFIMQKRFKSHVVAGITNLAFACEVFIKTLLVHQGSTVKGHELKSLWEEYKKVDCVVASNIENGILTYFNSKDQDLFDRLIDDASKAFVHWRYIYEKNQGKLNLLFLKAFRILLREVCCQKIYKQSRKDYIGGK